MENSSEDETHLFRFKTTNRSNYAVTLTTSIPDVNSKKHYVVFERGIGRTLVEPAEVEGLDPAQLDAKEYNGARIVGVPGANLFRTFYARAFRAVTESSPGLVLRIPELPNIWINAMGESADVVVVGGGVIGVCSAYYLAKLGRSVILVEKDEVGKGCSYANAGLITPSHALPIPAPGVIEQACKWMLHEDSPLLFRPRPDWGLIPWLIRFAAHCREEPVNRAIPVLRDLSRASLGLFEELVSTENLAFHFERRGLLSVYTTEKGFEKGKREASLLAKHGFQPKVLDGKQVCDLEPSVRNGLVGGIYYEEDAHGDCYRFVAGMGALIEKLGVIIRTNTRVTRIVPNRESRISLLTENGEYSARALVVATGSWTSQLAKDLRVRIPLQAGKGYSVTVDRPSVSPTIPLMNAARKVIVTPLGNRLRFAGTMEFAGLDLTLNETRTHAVLRGGLEIIAPCNSFQNIERWCGLRPCTPDGLPVIDVISPNPQICISTGHAMLGYTLGPITGKLVAELIAGRKLSMDINALRIGRF